MELENLYILDEKQGSNKFSFKLGPNQSTVKLLKPINQDLITSIQMRYEFNFTTV